MYVIPRRLVVIFSVYLPIRDYMLYLDIIKGHYRKNIKCLKGIHSRPVSVYIRILRSALWLNKLLLYPSVDFHVGLNSLLFPPSQKEPQHPKFMVSVSLDFHGGLNSVFPRHYKNNPNTLNAWCRMYLLRYIRINTTARGIHSRPVSVYIRILRSAL